MPTISHDEVRAAFARIEGRVAEDPLFEGGDIETFKGRLQQLPATVDEFFADTLQGESEAYRYAGLQLLGELVREHDAHMPTRHAGDLVLADGEVRCFRGDLTIDGDLLLGPRAICVVVGDLQLAGSLLADESDYTLLAVGGAMRAHGVMTRGELLVGGSLVVTEVVYLYRSDCSSRVAEVRARTLLENDSFDSFGRIRVQQRFNEPLSVARPERLRAIARIVGLGGITDATLFERELRGHLRRKPMMGEATPAPPADSPIA